MNPYSQAIQFGQALGTLQPRSLGALPLFLPILDVLQLRSVTNATVAGQADIDLGQILVILTLNRLLAPLPLYQIQPWIAQTVLPTILAVDPTQLYDMRLGRALDH